VNSIFFLLFLPQKKILFEWSTDELSQDQIV
jgi:hypothetical protein